jgi:DNA-binding response OmpR family regulator
VALAKTILVAEDDPVTRRFVVSLLEERGYEVLIAEDGEHALQLARSASPDLLVSDLVMPYRDGFEVLRAIRNDPTIAHLPVLILSMRDHEEDIVRGLESGADEYVVKPFNARELVARIRRLLERRRA